MSVSVSILNKKELKAYDSYVEALGLLIDLKPKQLKKVIMRMAMMSLLTKDEIEPFIRYLRRIS